MSKKVNAISNQAISKIMVKEITTTEKVQKKGNSFYILLRKEIAEELKITDNSLVELKIRKLPQENIE